jgi:hypothetical protein
MTKKIPARPNYLNLPPKDLLPKDKKTLTPSLLMATLARKADYFFQLSCLVF